MTSFTIQLPHKNNDNNGTVKNRIMKAIQEKFPFVPSGLATYVGNTS